ncbi:MAG: RagB/SusD family nutrient uptake outer membrane protein [Rikenellaceae bacterium]
MKFKNIKAALFSMVASSLIVSCTKDLEVFPLDDTIVSTDTAYTTAEDFTMALNKIYGSWSLAGQDGAGDSDVDGLDAGNTVLMRSWWTLQEVSADFTKCAWSDTWVGPVNSMSWGTNVEPIEGVYYRCMFIVALVNDFLKNIDKAPETINKAEYSAESRFSRALAYYTLMDLYANPPFITESNYSLRPSQLTRTELFDWIEAELLDIKGDLPVRYSQYGRADQSVVNALLARMYLNAEVYSGEARYTDAIAVSKEIIATGNYSLADNYAELFMADNGENPAANKEIIYPIIFDGVSTQSYGMSVLLFGSRGSSESSVETYGCNSGWDGVRSTGNLIRNFEFEGTSWTSDNIKDRRGIFYSDGRSIDITSSAIGTFTSEGWSVYKFTNLNSDGSAGKNSSFPDTDFPMFRLADIYLTYAEAVARGGSGGDISTAVEYINALRARGYGDSSANVTASWLTSSAPVSGSTTAVAYGNILNERARELYWEGTRRTDLIRYGLFTSSSYVWAEKGGVVSGVGTSSHLDIFPISANDMSANGSLVQNPGY